MIDPAEYLKSLRRTAVLEEFGWRLSTQGNPDIDYENRKIKRTLETLGQPELYESLLGDQNELQVSNRGVDDFDRLINMLSGSLKQDIRECVGSSCEAKLSKTALGLLPIGISNAFCINKTLIHDYEEQLDGYLICVNQGLYFCLQLLAKSIVLENLQGDLIQYRSCGGDSYAKAIDMYLNPKVEIINEIFFEQSSPEINGELSAYQSSIAMIILQFISLHEFGHISNGDLGIIGLHKLHFMSNAPESASVSLDLSYIENEYLADEFALKALCNRSKKPENAWANFSAIYLFFYWLGDIEKKLGGPISKLHPSPIARAERLHLLMVKLIGHESSFESHLTWIKESTNRWYNLKN